jgi:hypothetical protein
MLAREVNAASFDANHRQNNDLSRYHCGFFNHSHDAIDRQSQEWTP